MRGRRRLRAKALAVLTAILANLLVAAVVTAATTSTASATPNATIVHTGSGKDINVLNVGDSYAAGNGGGDYYTAAPDDPSAATSGFPGNGCYRSWNNASYLTYKALGSKGLYINRACSGAKTDATIPEVQNLSAGSSPDIGNSIDLITYSAGGDDGSFSDLVQHCFIYEFTDPAETEISVPKYGEISKNCYDLVNNLRSLTTVQVPNAYSTVVALQEDNIVSLLTGTFPNAKLVLDGYPLLVAQRPQAWLVALGKTMTASNGQSKATTGRNTWNFARNALISIESDVASQEQRLVSDLNGSGETAGRVAFNDLYASFGLNKGVGAGSNGYLVEPGTPTWIDVYYHPNPTGWRVISQGITNAVNAQGWFSNYPTQTLPPAQFLYYPGQTGAGLGTYIVSDAQGQPVNVGFIGSNDTLRNCTSGTDVSDGWVPTATTGNNLTLRPNGQDVVQVACSYPRPADLLTFAANGKSFVAANSGNGRIAWYAEPTAWMFDCQAAMPGVRRFQAGLSLYLTIGNSPAATGIPSCVPKEWLNKVLTGPDGASWLVDSTGYKHHILSTETYYALVQQYGSAIQIGTQVDVDTIPTGADQPELLYIPNYENGIIRRSDGVSWVVQGGVRHVLPDYATDICAQFVDNHPVLRTGLSYTLANTIPEGAAYVCNLENSILRAMDQPDPKPSYAYYSGARHWIADQYTYGYLASHGFKVVDVSTQAAILLFPDGGTEPSRLDPSTIPPNSIICRNDGVCWVVDGSGVRHHIPYVQDYICWNDLRGYPLSASNLTADQANALPETDAWPCIIGNRIVTSDDGSSYFVDTTNTKHWIPDTETYWVLAKSYPISGPWKAADVAQIPDGARMSYMIDPASVVNTIICRDDGVCWAVDGGGVRHNIPTYADNVCWRWVNGWHVSRNGLNYEQAASLSEAEAWGCNLGNHIIATNEGASYYMDGNTRRWIPDTETFYCYADRGAAVIRGMGIAEASGIPEGSWMPLCLSPNRVLNHIVRVNDGTAYFIDGAGWWYWIPSGGVWNCLTSRYPILIYSATWDQVNSIRRERGVWANCSM